MSNSVLRALSLVVVLALPATALAAPPTVTTTPATSITTSSAVLNGSGIPNSEATTGWFRYSSTNPVTCNDSFGTRVPAVSGTDLGMGTITVPYGITTTGLTSGVTYYYCAIVSNASGTAFGAVLSFTIPGPPVMLTTGAVSVTSSSATLMGSGNPVAATTTGWLRYSTTDPGTCNDTFGTRAPATGGSALGSGTSSVDYTQGIAGLLPGTTYYYCAIGSNIHGTRFGSVLFLTTMPTAPQVTTGAITGLSSTAAVMNATAVPRGDTTNGWFRFSTTTPGSCNDTFGTRVPASGGTALGSGNTAMPYSEPLTGLTPLTTYYYCAIAQNGIGTTIGALSSFTTPTFPSVTTTVASAITNTAASLNGSANPNRATTTGWFRYASTDPGGCNDTFGSRAPVSGGSALGSGSVSVGYTQPVTTLSPGTTYYFCAIASNSEGMSFGSVLSFTTLATPSVVTNVATLVTATSATLNGTSDPNGATATGWYRYSATNPGACSDAFGTRAPAAGGTALGAGTTPVGYTQGIAGLVPTTTYYYCAISSNVYGTSFGSLLSFTTPAALPAVTTSAATLLTGTTAQLNGSANPNGDSTTGWFRFGTVSPGTCNDSFGTRAPLAGGTSLGSGTTSVAFNEAIVGLTPGTLYHYCAIGSNGLGTSFGGLLNFTTPAAPTVITSAATPVASTTATLNGSGDPNGATATGWFRYSATNPGTCNDTFGSRAPATGGSALGSGTASVAYAQALTGLSVGTTYYFCAIASNAEGTAFGSVLMFTTLAAPTVTTSVATLVTSSAATLNGLGNPNGATSTGWYRYSTVSPGTCNDTFGTRAPATGGTALGAGVVDVSFPRALAGLTAGATYYFCAIANNVYGNGFGAVLSFTTPAAVPVVTTSTATPLTGTTGQLNGSANPGGDATIGWFRYSTVSPGSCNDSFGTRAPVSGGTSLGSGTASVAYSAAIAGLTPGTTYYFCALASNSAGTGIGNVVPFITPSAPIATTTAATGIAATSATLNGTGNPNRANTTGWFRYSSTNPGTCDDTFGSRAPISGGTALGGGSAPVAYGQLITALSVGTTYYFCAIVSSAEGTAFGSVMSFTTLAAPTVTTSLATLVTSSSATLNGLGNPNGATSTGWYRYSTTSPGTCNDTFGTRAPTTGGTALGAGVVDVSFPRAIASLTPATTYYFCAIASNVYGTGLGTVLSFTTPALAPSVTTSAATLLTGATGQLNGSANPNGDATTGWFRYSTVSPGTCNDSFGTRSPAAGGTSLGSGITSAAYSVGITGLTPNTTYYYCAIAQNSIGTSFGAVVPFITPGPPTVATVAASAIAATSATLNGTGDPHRALTTGWFRYSSTNPGTCDDTFGSRAPVSGGTSLGSGSGSVPYGQSATGLSVGTTYYFCAIASNAEGIAFGNVLSFTTLSAPAVTTNAATLVTSSSATLNGLGNPNGATATGWYRYATTNPGTCNDTFGTRAPATGGSALGAGTTDVSFPRAIAGLTPATTYYFCALASNVYGTGLGSVLSFTTPAIAPTVTTSAATLLTGATAQLNGSANPNGDATTGWFRYSTVSPGSCNDSFGTRAPVSGGTSLGSGITATAYSVGVTGLTPSTTYYYCAIAQNSLGTALGALIPFITPGAPTATTNAASLVAATTATLNGSGNPNRALTTGWYRYSATNPGACDDTFGTRAPVSGGTSLGSGAASVAYTQAITGLTSGTTYYFCAIVSSAEGTAFGSVLNFTTLATPAVTTAAATLVTSTTATLNGSADPNAATTTGWFRYSAVSPGSCNDTFGTRAPATGGTALGAGTVPVAYAQAIAGLLPGATYYYCAIASNAVGTGLGALLSFTTPAGAPTVSTNAPTGVTTTTATLNGSANPNGDSTTAWFRIDTVNPGTCNDTFGTRVPGAAGAALGAGNTAVAYSQTAPSIGPGVTYYYCAIAQNLVGLSVGTVRTFTTPAPPSVNTLAATPVTAVSATLNASANPNGYATTAWFRYSTTTPGTCNDTFGTRTPAAGGAGLGAGTALVAFAQALTGLSPGTTYYFCGIASSSIGTSFGGVLSFTTPPTQPSVTTLAASAVSPSGATLNGSANPNGDPSTGWFRYSTVNPGTCNDTFGTRTPAAGGTALGAGNSPVAFSAVLTGLPTGVTYYFCALGSNTLGTSIGNVLTFTTNAVPSVTTVAATVVGTTTATLPGSANPNLTSATGYFRYSTTNPGSCNDTFGTRAPAAGGTALGAGSSAVGYMQAAAGLTPGATYYYCALATNTVGTGFGTVLSFTTTAAPSVTSNPAVAVTGTGATLDGSANPNLASATGYFRYSTTSPGSCNDTFGTRSPASGGSALGAGSSAVGYMQALTGLTPGATYYFCAIASNTAGTGLGALLSFTTPAAPTVVSLAATGVLSTSATLEGSGDPNLASSTGYFRYSTTSPGTCNDTFGTRAPASGGAPLGAGSVAVPYAEPLAGLTPGTRYYYCAIATNAVGTGLGTVLSFITTAAPGVTTSAATLVASTTATINGSANPNLTAATGWYRYSTTNPGTCDDSFGTRAPASGGTALGAGSVAVSYTQPLTGLTLGATYYFCAIASNAIGTAFGSVLTFTTTAAPAVTTNVATAVTSTGATLDGSANPNLASATGYFRYSATDPGTCNDTFGTRAPVSGGTALGAGSTATPYTQAAAGLTAGTTYFYCAIASNSVGTGFGTVQSFTTLAAPSVTTVAASGVTDTGALLNGSANPNLASATGYFRYATTSPGVCNDTFGTRTPGSGGTALGAGSAVVSYSEVLTGLLPGTTYHYCAIASSSVGTGFGSVLSFTTQAGPTVTTEVATAVSSIGATLGGTANPQGASATGYFRYGTTNPGTCSDTFGTRAPVSGGSGLGSGTTVVAFTEMLTGLLPGTTYYYCALATSSVGTGSGSVLSFTTSAAPIVTTNPATALSSTGATLNGSANPSGADATGWFRYDTTAPATCNDLFGTRTPGSGGTALGAASAVVPYTTALTGLAPSTTYHYCAIASNSVGTSFGAVLTFTTPAAPTVTTELATAVTSGGATLGGLANPNGADATGWFRWSSTDPGACSDTFGTRAPTTGGSALGAGTTPAGYGLAVTGLSPTTTYYYCAIASNVVGTGFGAIETFTTIAGPAAPSVTTEAATAPTDTGGTLNGTVNPNLADATAWFRYTATDPGACNDTFGTRAPTAGGTAVGAGAVAVPVSEVLTGLAPATTYYFCAIASNANGTSFGELLTMTTGASAPSVTTAPPTAVTDTSATLNGSAIANGDDTDGWFRFDTTDPGTCDDTFGVRAPTTGGTALGAGSSAVAFAEPITALTSGVTYYYCAIASNSLGTVFGEIVMFEPGALPPVVTTEIATAVLTTSATIAGTADPNGTDTTGWFRYGTTDPGVCDDSFGTRAPGAGGAALGAGTEPAPYTEALMGLAPNSTYFYCAAASNLGGASFGDVLSFTTDALPPLVRTVSATNLPMGVVMFSGAANPRGAETTGWFRYSATDPGTCNDTFGTFVGSSTLGAGMIDVPFSEPVSGLAEGTYFVCAIGSNSAGTAFGEVLTFTVPPGPVMAGGCGCRVAATGSASSGAAFLSLAALSLVFVRRRRRRS